MNLWTQPDRRTYLHQAEDLANAPSSGGRAKQWLAGALLAAVPVVYGIECLQCGSTTLFGRHASSMVLTGDTGLWLAVSYIALGAFLHFHFFWGLSDRLWRFSQFMKALALLVFLPSFLYVIFHLF